MKMLKDIFFADLLILDDGFFFRYLEGEKESVVKVPVVYRDEIVRIRDEVIEIARIRKENEFFYSNMNIPYRVAVIHTISGTGYFLRRLKLPVPVLDTLGFSDSVLSTLKSLGKARGLILVAGATGSGKSTTIYSLLTNYLSVYGDVVLSVEDPPELPVQGGYFDRGIWYQVDANSVGGYEKAMISAMRYNPRYIFLGEIRSSLSAREAIRAAVNGHLVVTTIHGNSIQGAIYALQQIALGSNSDIDLVRSILGDGLLAVLHQELIFTPAGTRKLQADLLYIGGVPGITSKIRSGKLELLNNDIDTQNILLNKGINLHAHYSNGK
ncbi:ATPase, T2SS/T4P/T4SS family [Escherichia coli]|uniref:ATPase, T2SS/T4P/T4SS family n=1 Tax=Escherichia coli TaxID=562 RepID=UPI00199165EE|nr:ATPase, T2SS/T4P/T4SS family [Escherichia coli]EEU9261459.1 type II/IV secretion system family protein [Escherichia coli]EIR2337475.1 Flp pilus assembly complex ATPase component TadA [Escherichia coli]MCQ0124533.1 Flp pilus assembly complex ATPase component TadA [Escherichia coli]MCQ0455955.1 Flp pilus assembly complex ATPase component TadA [Escherichia coli]HAM9616866.1 Flp pilus assembly complex ATPase component [Escherichia coli]